MSSSKLEGSKRMNILLVSRYAREQVTIEKLQYPNGRTALVAYSAMEEVVMKLTVNLPDAECPDDCVFIKDYSENEGALECLVKNLVVGPPMRYEKSGFVNIPMCRLMF